MKRLIVAISIILVLSACSERLTIIQDSRNSKTMTTTSSTSKSANETPDLLLLNATKYYEEGNLTEVNRILLKLMINMPKATEQIAAVLKMSDELAAIKEIEDAELEKKLLAEVNVKLEKLKFKEDEVTGITWYRDKSSTEYDNENSFQVYFGKTEATLPSLRLRIQYADDNWLFIKHYIIKTDDNTFTIFANFKDINRDNDGRSVWEWLDIPVSSDSEDYRMIKAIIASEKTIIRFEGDQYYEDRTLTNKEKNALKNVLEAYEAYEAYETLDETYFSN